MYACFSQNTIVNSIETGVMPRHKPILWLMFANIVIYFKLCLYYGVLYTNSMELVDIF